MIIYNINIAETNEPQHSEKKFNAPPPNPKMGFNPSNIPLPPHKNPVPPESNLKEMQPNMTPPKKSQDIKPSIIKSNNFKLLTIIY